MRSAAFLLPYTLPLAAVAGHAFGGVGDCATLALVFVLLPVADRLAGDDTRTLLAPGAGTRAQRLWFDALLYLWVPVQFALLVWGARTVAAEPAAGSAILLTVSIGVITGGIGITVAHELGHRRARRDGLLAGALLASVSYGHFQVEHNQGHHAYVATPEDPATARAGESFYAFLPRAIATGFAGAWRIERRRLAAAGRALASPANRMLWIVVAPVAIGTALALAYGARAAAFYVVQSMVAFTLLEGANYVEHWGLLRRRRADGRYETVRPAHSWNSSRALTNAFLFNLQRHSHHHAHVTRRYQELEHMENAPQLPAGYPAMILLALVPPLWRRVMGPRLRRWQDEQQVAA